MTRLVSTVALLALILTACAGRFGAAPSPASSNALASQSLASPSVASVCDHHQADTIIAARATLGPPIADECWILDNNSRHPMVFNMAPITHQSMAPCQRLIMYELGSGTFEVSVSPTAGAANVPGPPLVTFSSAQLSPPETTSIYMYVSVSADGNASIKQLQTLPDLSIALLC